MRVQRAAAIIAIVAGILSGAAVARAEDPQPTPTPPPPPPPPPAHESVWANLPIRFYANVNLREDFQTVQDKADLLLPGNEVNGLLTRIRFGLEYRDTKATVSGGVRVSVGEMPNPASPFTRLGDAFRPVAFGFDQFYVDVRPFKNKERVYFTLGKMPQPFWRGDRGAARSEFHWDDDISPVGGALHLNLFRSDDEHHSVSIDNTTVYYIVEWFRQNRFEGLRGDTSLYADQLVLKFHRFTVAGTYYFWDNLNSGARAPSFTPNVGAFVAPGTSAFLLRPGPQVTNARLNVGGSGAFVFRENRFHIGDVLAQASVPVGVPGLGRSEVFALGEISHNFSVPFENDGWGVTLGITGGAYTRKLHPFTLWGTWRRVEMDAALGTFADSDLGPGTDVKGLEISATYKITRNLGPYISYFNVVNAPFRSTTLDRVFFGLDWDF